MGISCFQGVLGGFLIDFCKVHRDLPAVFQGYCRLCGSNLSVMRRFSGSKFALLFQVMFQSSVMIKMMLAAQVLKVVKLAIQSRSAFSPFELDIPSI